MTNQTDDYIIRGRDVLVQLFETDPQSIVTPLRMADFTWLQRNNEQIALALEGILGEIVILVPID